VRAKVLAGVLVVTLGALAAFDVAAIGALRGYLIAQTDTQLRTVVGLYRASPHLAIPAKSFVRVATPVKWLERDKRAAKRFSIVGPHLVLQPAVLDQYHVEFITAYGSKQIFAGNPDLQPRLPTDLPAFAGQRAVTVASLNGRAKLRMLAVPLTLHATEVGTLVITSNLGAVDRTVGRLQLILIIGSVAAGLLVAFGVALIARRGLRPIETMAAQADKITAGDLTERVCLHDPQTEVGRLATALNGMLARIEADVEQRLADQDATRRFFADASHELRTPLASLRANAELYQQGALAERRQVDEAMRRITLEAKRMGKLVDDMLRLARLDQHPERQHDLVDLSELIQGCLDRAQAASPQRLWRGRIAPDLLTVGDDELLRSAIDNLLTNIRAHTPEQAVADIAAARHNGTITIDVSDDGPGVATDQLPHIFDRFYRAPAHTRRPGSGLGLAIVTAVAAAHHGAAEAALNDPHGLRVRLTLPACTASLDGTPGACTE
jgi:two-component system, OmpR family, sensor kinase